MKYVKELDRVRLRDSCRFGPKASVLGELRHRGLRVPAGFVIAPDAFAAGQLVPRAQKEILRSCERLRNRSVAVRSSSVAEDTPDASSAGQFKTFLNVSGEHEIIKAIGACTASGSGAADYLRAFGRGGSARVAVLVQEMVEAHAAGVLFTADPVSGDRGVSTLEAVSGLGDRLVSGRAEPFRWVIDDDGTVKEAPDGAAPLELPRAIELAQLGRRIEKLLGGPQDIEWACDKRGIQVLQSRPITTLAAGASSRDVWSNSNVVENLPGVLSPMTISSMAVIEGIARNMLRAVGFLFPEDMRLLGFRAGRAYLNFGAFYVMADALPGAKREDINVFLGGMQEVPEPERTRVSILRKALILARSVPILLHLLRLPFVERSVSSRFIRKYRRLAGADLRKLDSLQLAREIRRWWGVSFMYGRISLPFTSRAFAFWGLLNRLADRWLGADGTGLVNRLITGLTRLPSTVPMHELWKLSRQLLRDRELGSCMSLDNPQDVLEASEKGRRFLKELYEVLDKYCYRCDRELDVSVPRLSEERETVYSMLRSFTETPEHLGPPAVELRQRGVYLQAMKEARQRLGWLRWALLKPLLRQARRALVGRDRTKSIGSMSVAGFRLLMLEAGSRLAAARVTEERDDVFYLEIEELFRALAGRLTADEIGALMLRRKRQEDTWRKEVPPDVIAGDINAPIKQAATETPVGESLSGMGVSAGSVTAAARIIMGKEDFHKLQPGEILVAPWTDPGWTSLFLIAGGLVADVGGMLSHGSIVAREIGIPAVTNVRKGTSIISDGQTITVDGSRGVVDLNPDSGLR